LRFFRGNQLPQQSRRFHHLALIILLSAVFLFASGYALMVHDAPITAMAASQETSRSYADALHFWLGTTFQGRFWYDAKYKNILSTDFNSGVSFVMFPMTEPQPGQFDFGGMDHDMSFANAHGMKLFGAALVYRPGGGPDWLKNECRTWSKGKMDQVLRDHIHAVVQHGGDTYYGWEVVNEPTNISYNGCWSQVLGRDEYIVKAFRYAREAAPNAELLLNDSFGREGVDKGKIHEFFDLVRRLKSSGVPIDAVGVEMHLDFDALHPGYLDEFKSFLAQAKQAGVQAQVTEMDVTMSGADSGPDALQKQKEIFYNVVHTCLQDSNCTGFTTWGLADGMRYMRSLEVPHDQFEAEQPLLFDDNLNPKPAFAGVLEALKEGR
jgi:endo-1,4-beta-xylanase